MSLQFFRKNSDLTSSGEGVYEVGEWTLMRASPGSLTFVIVERKYIFTCRMQSAEWTFILTRRNRQYFYTYQNFPNIRKSNSVCMLKGILRFDE